MNQTDLDEFGVYIITELGLSQKTFRAYKKDVQDFLQFKGKLPLTVATITNFVDSLSSNGLKSTSVRRKYMAVRCFCRHLISRNQLDSEILDYIDPVHVSKEQHNVLDHSDFQTILTTLEKIASTPRNNNVCRNVAIILTLYYSGLRVSELCNLDLQDVKLSKREMIVKGKGGRYRIVPITYECASAIQNYLTNRPNVDTNALFITQTGSRVSRRAVSNMLTTLAYKAGIKHITAHTMRRSCATSLLHQGIELELIRQLLGHKNLCTTQDYLLIDNAKLIDIHSRCHPTGAKSNG